MRRISVHPKLLQTSLHKANGISPRPRLPQICSNNIRPRVACTLFKSSISLPSFNSSPKRSWFSSSVISASSDPSIPTTAMPLDKSEYISDVWREGIFNDKVVFCTGGAGTICSAQVRALVHLGANAFIIGRNPEKTERMAKDIATARKGAKVIGLGNVDVRNVESLNAAAQKCVEELGGIDFTIAGAAGNFLATINQISSNAFKSVIDIDVLGSYNTIKATLPYLVESAAKHKIEGGKSPKNGTGGRIIFVSATLHYSGTPFQAHVGAAKAAIDALSNGLAIEQGPRGITSNVIAPGPIANTEGMERLARKEDYEAGTRIVPLGRWGSVKDIADATVYLFSDTGNFVNGEILVVDGGAWRTSGPGGLNYPQEVLDDAVIQGVKGQKKSKL